MRNYYWQIILKFQYRFKIQNTELKRSPFTRNYFGRKVHFLYQNLPKFVTEFFKCKIILSPELMSNIFELLKNHTLFEQIRDLGRRIQTTKNDMGT